MGKTDLLTNTLQPESGSSGFTGIPVLIAGLTGNAKLDSGSVATVKDSAETVVSFVVGAGLARSLQQVLCSCTQEGKMEVFVDSLRIGIKRTSPGRPNVELKFWPPYPISAGETVAVKFTALNNPSVDVDVDVHSTEQSI